MGVSRVGDVANPAPGERPCVEAIPNEPIRDKVCHHLNGSPLQPVCETLINGSAHELPRGLDAMGRIGSRSIDVDQCLALMPYLGCIEIENIRNPRFTD